MNCKGKNSLGPGSLVGKKRHKMGWKEVQKQLASERSESSGGLAKGKGRRLFPSQVTCSACLARLFVFCAFHPVFCFLSHQGAWSWARRKIKQKEDRSNLCSGKKKSWKKIQAYTRFKYFTYAISAAPVSVNGSNPVTARIISAFLLLHLYPQRSSLHLK